ncbi:MAG: CPBP family intramembrane metalloprotease [Candidatus Amulumruptor caecigallinarius]|nr:CPBP family intramembrane metalloprotease [Candidatus Amulumruptor caecigallinarius]MCM1397116.1 CPBP family intramembrane metalloprotease [Candidatus Amulumruptor caecigallinarius]MCM1453926.1 CPBP family intramembrane metalloprotease [bacterium]
MATLNTPAPAPSVRMTFARRIVMFLCISTICMLITGVIMAVVTRAGLNVKSLRIAAIVQDLIVFVTPAILCAVIFSAVPARYLGIERAPRPLTLILAIVAMICSVPLMNCIIAWNEGLHLPAAFASVEEWMKLSEESARTTINMLTGGGSVGSLVMSLLIVGVLAGFSEELFFRGGVQRLLVTRPMNPHAAIWIAAFVFSAVHLQFYGFFPRVLLGAFFGYMLYWSGSLWIPVLCHIYNNSVICIATWRAVREGHPEVKSIVDTLGADPVAHWPWIAASTVATIVTLYLLWRLRVPEERKRDA